MASEARKAAARAAEKLVVLPAPDVEFDHEDALRRIESYSPQPRSVQALGVIRRFVHRS